MQMSARVYIFAGCVALYIIVYGIQRIIVHFQIRKLTKAIEMQPNSDTAYFKRAVCYAEKGKQDKYFADLNTAIRINPNNYEAYCLRGSTYIDEKKFAQALTDCNRAIEINPNCGAAYACRAACYFAQKQYDLSWADVHKAQELKANVPNGFLNDLKKASGTTGS